MFFWLDISDIHGLFRQINNGEQVGEDSYVYVSWAVCLRAPIIPSLQHAFTYLSNWSAVACNNHHFFEHWLCPSQQLSVTSLNLYNKLKSVLSFIPISQERLLVIHTLAQISQKEMVEPGFIPKHLPPEPSLWNMIIPCFHRLHGPEILRLWEETQQRPKRKAK